MNDQPTAADLTPEQLQQIHAQVSGTISDFHDRAQDLKAQAQQLLDQVEKENADRLRAAQQEAGKLRGAAFVQDEVARQLANAARAATVLPTQPPAAASPPQPGMPDMVQRVAGNDVPPMPPQTQPGLQGLREVVEGDQSPPRAQAGPPPGGGAPFRGGPPPYGRPL